MTALILLNAADVRAQDSSVVPAGPVKVGRSCVAADTSLGWDWIRWPKPDSSTPRATLDSLETVLANTPDSVQAPVLLALGRAKAAFQPDDEYARARADEFHHNEIAGAWMYTGWHFAELRRRFPGHDLADDAAWEQVALPMGGECEGYVACYVHTVWYRAGEFLRAYPASPFADSAVRLALFGFTQVTDDMDLIHGGEHIEPDEIRKLVASLDSLGRLLPAAGGARLLARAGELWEQLGALENARSAWQAVAALNDPSLGECVTARLAALPRDVLTMHAPRVVHPKRVELSWLRLAGGASAYAVTRAPGRDSIPTFLATVPATAVGWTDTSTTPGTVYWYRIIALRGADSVGSLPARADVPTWEVRPEAVAVGADGRLHIYGMLANGFPQVLRVSADGQRMTRMDGVFVGASQYASPWVFRSSIRDVFLADQNGDGLLRLPVDSAARDSVLARVVRRGADLFDQRASDVRGPESLVVSVDERTRVAWAGREYGGRERLSALDCLAADSLCWMARDGALVLEHDNGRPLARVTLQGRGTYNATIAAIHADPLDRSAWVLLQVEKRLVHVDRQGMVIHDVTLADARGWVNAATVDFDRRAIWVVRRSGRDLQLLRIDMKDPQLRPGLVATMSGNPRWLVPDRQGGAWLVSGEDAWHVDASGRVAGIDAVRGALRRS